MKRGDIVIAAAPGFGKRPRPYVVIQADEYAALTTAILLPITTAHARSDRADDCPALWRQGQRQPAAADELARCPAARLQCGATAAISAATA